MIGMNDYWFHINDNCVCFDDMYHQIDSKSYKQLSFGVNSVYGDHPFFDDNFIDWTNASIILDMIKIDANNLGVEVETATIYSIKGIEYEY